MDGLIDDICIHLVFICIGEMLPLFLILHNTVINLREANNQKRLFRNRNSLFKYIVTIQHKVLRCKNKDFSSLQIKEDAERMLFVFNKL